MRANGSSGRGAIMPCRQPPAGRRGLVEDWAAGRLAPASLGSDFEAAETSAGLEVHHKRNARHEQNFPPEQNAEVEPVEIAVPRSRRRSLVGGRSDGGHEVITPARHRDQEIPRQPHDQDRRPEKNAELLGHAATNDTLKRSWLGHDRASDTTRGNAAGVRAGILLVLGRSRLREEGRVIDPGGADLANLAQDKKHILLAGQGSEQRAFRQDLELLSGYLEALDEFAVVSNLIEDRALFAWREHQMILSNGFHATNSDAEYGLKQE